MLRVDATAESPYLAIRAGILDGELAPGTELSASDLGARLHVSRTPVTAALARLIEDGLVEKQPRGHRVRERSLHELLDVFDARIALEAAAARLAAERWRPDDLAQLNYVTEVLQSETDLAAQDRLNTLWHHTVVDAADNETIGSMLDQVRTQLAIYRPMHTSRRTAESSRLERAEHQAILDAIRDRDPDRAHLLMTQHLVRGREMRLHYLEDDPSPSW